MDQPATEYHIVHMLGIFHCLESINSEKIMVNEI